MQSLNLGLVELDYFREKATIAIYAFSHFLFQFV